MAIILDLILYLLCSYCFYYLTLLQGISQLFPFIFFFLGVFPLNFRSLVSKCLISCLDLPFIYHIFFLYFSKNFGQFLFCTSLLEEFFNYTQYYLRIFECLLFPEQIYIFSSLTFFLMSFD
jgi:hypothetical protein